MIDKSILEKIQKGDMSALADIYSEYRMEFISWLKKNYSCDDESAQDIYQASMLSLYENILLKKLTDLSSSLKTYLFGIGKNKARELQRLHSKEIKLKELYSIEDHSDEEDKELKEKNINSLAEALEKLGDPCRKLLKLFYFQQKALDEITELLKYKNTETTKNIKYKCILRLRKIYKTI